MKALVTGCAMFIGSHLTDWLLADGYNVIGIDCFTDYYAYNQSIKKANISDGEKNFGFTFVEKDPLKMDFFLDGDYIFHRDAQRESSGMCTIFAGGVELRFTI